MKENKNELECVFITKKFLIAFAVINIVPYLCWVFVELSFSKPFIETFSTSKSRGLYLSYLISLFLCALPYYAPFINKKK